jgi:excisionase family DNA binding protein
MTPREELMSAALSAPEERIGEAIRQLRGETPKPIPQTTGPLLIGMGKAAELLNLSRATLWRMLKRGVFEKVEVLPGSFRLRRADLEAFVANGGLQGEKRLKESNDERCAE